MYDFGSSDPHTNKITLGHIAALDAMSAYSTAQQIYLHSLPGYRNLFGKLNTSTDQYDGWNIAINSSGAVFLTHGDGASYSDSSEIGVVSATTQHTLVTTWDGSTFKVYVDGGSPSSVAYSKSISSAPNTPVTINTRNDDGRSGAPARQGHIMFWDDALTDQEAWNFHAGMMPRLDALVFWVPGIMDPDSDWIGQNAGTKSGTVVIAEDVFTTWYWPFDEGADPGAEAEAPAAALQIGDTPILELSLPGGTKYYGSAETNVLSSYQGKILTWGQISNGVSEASNTLARVETPVTIDDNDKEFAHLLEGANGHQIRGSAATIRILGSGLTAYTRFAGVIDSWSQSESNRYTINLRPNDTPLERKFPKMRITQFDWPNADPDALGRYVPIVLGYQSSVGDTDEGMVPTYYVDTENYVYLVAFGYLKEVTNVYVDGTKTTSGFTITHPVVNGKQFTCIDFSGDQSTSIITADVQGYENQGNGSGTLVTSPVRQIEHVLENFIFGDYQSGTWASGVAPIDDMTLAIADNFMLDEGYEGSVYIADDQIKGRDFVNDWLKTWEMRAYWTRDGNIAFLGLDHRTKDLVISSPWIRWEQEEMGLVHNVEVTAIIDRLTGSHVRNSVDDRLKQSLEVRDPSIDEEAAESLDMIYGSARMA